MTVVSRARIFIKPVTSFCERLGTKSCPRSFEHRHGDKMANSTQKDNMLNMLKTRFIIPTTLPVIVALKLFEYLQTVRYGSDIE